MVAAILVRMASQLTVSESDVGKSGDQSFSLKELGFEFREIGPHDQKLVDPVLRECGVISNFTCFPQLYAFLRKPTNHLYLVTTGDKYRIVLLRNSDLKDVRILFEKTEGDKALVRALIEGVKPKYIGYNFVPDAPPTNSNPEKVAVRDELIIDIPTVANLEVDKLKKSYQHCRIRHTQLIYRRAGFKDKNQIFSFVHRWSQRESMKQRKMISSANVKHYLEMFLGSNEVRFGAVLDKDKVVGLTAYCPHPAGLQLAVSTLSMVDRGFKQLGVFTKVEQCRAMKEEGYLRALIGGRESTIVNENEETGKADFKMRFMKNGSINTYYAYEVYRVPDLSIGKNFLRDIWA